MPQGTEPSRSWEQNDERVITGVFSWISAIKLTLFHIPHTPGPLLQYKADFPILRQALRRTHRNQNSVTIIHSSYPFK